MTSMNHQDVAPGENKLEFHLIDLVPADCCHKEKIGLERKLQRLEQSLNDWLRQKIAAIESEKSISGAGTGAEVLSNGQEDETCAPAGHGIGQEAAVILMSTDDRDILEVLRAELDFIEKGGYGRSVRTPWRPKSPFRESLTCINYTYPEKVHPCSECHLIDFVPGDKRSEEIPCHFIPLNESGETLEQLEATDDQQKLEKALKSWLRTEIKEIEAARGATQKPPEVS
jgi:hypothetical protein